MKQTSKKTIKNAAYFGVKVTVEKSLDAKYLGKVLFAEKVTKANQILSKLKNPLPA